MSESKEAEDRTPAVIQDLRSFLPKSSNLGEEDDIAMSVAAIKALLGVVQRSQSNTMMGLQEDLQQAKALLLQEFVSDSTTIALTSGCELFLKYVTRALKEFANFEACRQHILERGERFAGMSLAARDRIGQVARDFVQEGHTVLTHGWSRVVATVLRRAAETKHFDVIVLEGRPDAAGVRAANYFQDELNIPTTVVLDSAMGYIMESVDIVLVGAEGVVENGGVVNKTGTYALATCAKANDIPFYVAAESYKFARLYPLHQRDLPPMGNVPLEFCDTTIATKKDDERVERVPLADTVKVDNPPCDYTPAKFITLLFTDLGVLTPSAVSDELIRLYS